MTTVPYYFVPAFGLGTWSWYRAPFWYGYGGYPLWYGYGGYPYYADSYSGSPALETGGLRLKIKPKEAQVYVDGSYAGVVDDFNGPFQHLDLAPGLHHISVREPGYAPLELDVTIRPHATTTFSGVLPRISS